MKAAWCTDIHINFLSLNMRRTFYEKLRDSGAQVIFITGDIAEARDIENYLEKLREIIHPFQKVYFVAGNHDYYSGTVEGVRKALGRISHGNIRYLPWTGLVYLTDDVSLVGVDGWADGQYGDYFGSPVILNDSVHIADLYEAIDPTMSRSTQQNRLSLLTKMQELANKDAKTLDGFIGAAVEAESKRVIILTHIPPFPEASLYKGKVADEDYLPFYTCKATGDVILDYATRFPEIRFLVLCGHSHSEARYEPLHNLTVKTGGAQYYMPEIQEVFDI